MLIVGLSQSQIKVCCIGYPQGTRVRVFYSSSDKKVFKSIHAYFSNEDYINVSNQKSNIILEKLALIQEQYELVVSWPLILLIPMHVQKGENVLKGEQV